MNKKLMKLLGAAALVAAASLSTPAVSQAYRCPTGIPYCQSPSQCVTFCGSVQFAVCFNGCCTCSG
jgi:hypothetical protein